MQKLEFYLDGAVTPKARPRVSGNGTYMPQKYQTWRRDAEFEIEQQIRNFNPAPNLPFKKASVSLKFTGKHRKNADLDNLAGAVLDVLTEKSGVGVLTDDNIQCVTGLFVEYDSVGETGVHISIRNLNE